MSDIPDNAPAPRLCIIGKWEDFEGYGFNLHAEKSKPGQYIGKVDTASPAEMAGLMEGDRIVEVNGVNIANENHKQVVTRIKAVSGETQLLVLSPEVDKYYKSKNIVVKGSQSNVLVKSSHRVPPSPEPALPAAPAPITNGTTNGHHHDEDTRSVSSAASSSAASEASTQPQPTQDVAPPPEAPATPTEAPTDSSSSLPEGGDTSSLEDDVKPSEEDLTPPAEDKASVEGGDAASESGTVASEAAEAEVEVVLSSPELEAEPAAEVKPEVEAEIKEVVEAEAEAKIVAEVTEVAEVKTEVTEVTEVKAEVTEVVEAEVKPEVEAKTEVDGKAEVESDLEAEYDNVVMTAGKGVVEAVEEAAPPPPAELASRRSSTASSSAASHSSRGSEAPNTDHSTQSPMSTSPTPPPSLDNTKTPTPTPTPTPEPTPDPTPTPAPITPTPTPTPTAKPTLASNNAYNSSGLNLNMSAAEMRAMLARKKKADPRNDSLDLRKKYEIIQNM